jgi:hypothetical protein
MSGAPAVLIPRGLQQVHPQLEPAFKSIADAIARLHSTASAAASPGLATSVAGLEQEIGQLQAEIAALGAGGAAEYTAGSPIPAYSVVREVSVGVVGVADSSSLATAYGVSGIASAAAVSGSAVALARLGDTVTNAGWSWTPGPVFLAAAGGLTQSAPAIPVLVGHAISATSVLVSIDGPYLPLLRSVSDPAGYLLYINNSDGTLRYSNGSAWVRLGTLDQISTAVATVGLGGQTLTDIADAVDPTDAVNLQTLTGYLANLSSREACAYATATALPANTYNNGASGVGATLTASANGALSVDGAAPAAGVRILVQNEVTAANNGIYVVTQAGGAAAPWILTRATDADSVGQLGPGLIVPVEAPGGATPGAANNGLVFISLGPSPFTVGTSSITFTSTGRAYSADGTTIALTGTQFGLAPIANNTVLGNTSGAAAKPAAIPFSALGSGSGVISFVESQTVSGASSVTFPSSGTLQPGYEYFVVGALGAAPNASATLRVQFAAGTPPVFDTSTDYAWYQTRGDVQDAHSYNDTAIQILPGSTWQQQGIRLELIGDAGVSQFHGLRAFTSAWGAPITGQQSALSPVTAFNLFWSSGNISGTFALLSVSLNPGVAYNSSGTYAARPAAPAIGAIYKCTDAPCELLYQGGMWQYWYNDVRVTPPNAESYSWINQGNATNSATGPYQFLRKPAADNSASYYLRTLPATPYAYTMLVLPQFLNRQYLSGGMCIYADSNGYNMYWGITGQAPNQSAGSSPLFGRFQYDGPATFVAGSIGGEVVGYGPIWFQLVDDGTNFTYKYSLDGQNFIQFLQESRTSFLTPTHIGAYLDTSQTSGSSYDGAMLFISANF